jgi:hypothetical protein
MSNFTDTKRVKRKGEATMSSENFKDLVLKHMEKYGDEKLIGTRGRITVK